MAYTVIQMIQMGSKQFYKVPHNMCSRFSFPRTSLAHVLCALAAQMEYISFPVLQTVKIRSRKLLADVVVIFQQLLSRDDFIFFPFWGGVKNKPVLGVCFPSAMAMSYAFSLLRDCEVSNACAGSRQDPNASPQQKTLSRLGI